MGDIPANRATDHEDVTLALDVARSQLAKGDVSEAMKWLRKAADAAFDADDDRRGIELSKAAADLQAHPPKNAGARPVMPAPKAAPPPMPKPSVPAPAAHGPAMPQPGQPRMPKPVVPTSATTRRSEVPPAPAPAPPARAAKASGPSRGRMPSVHGRKSMRKAPDPIEESTREFQVANHAPAARQPAPSPVNPTADEWPTETVDDVRELVEVVPKEVSADRFAATAPSPVSTAFVAPPVITTQSLRVAISRTPDGIVVCRPLDAGGTRAGEHDAVLVALTADTDLAVLFRG